METGVISVESLAFTNDPNIRISQLSWYLSIVAGTYESITCDGVQIPIPFQLFFGQKRVYVPPFVQRIGIPSRVHHSAIEASFLSTLIDTYQSGLICIDADLNLPEQSVIKSKRTNYILKLDKNYPELFHNYHKGHQLNIKKFKRSDSRIEESEDIDTFVKFYSRNSNSKIPLAYKNEALMRRLIQACYDRRAGKIYIARGEDNQMLAAAFFTFYNGRIVYLSSCSNKEGKEKFAMHAILDRLIYEYCNSSWVLDFEGSMIPGIAYFMKGFGSIEETYYSYQWNNGGLLGFLIKARNFLKNVF